MVYPKDGIPTPQPQQLPPNTALPDLLYWGEDHDGLPDGWGEKWVIRPSVRLFPLLGKKWGRTRHFWGKVGYPAFRSKIVSPPPLAERQVLLPSPFERRLYVLPLSANGRF